MFSKQLAARSNYRIDGITINGDPQRPETFPTADNEREWTYWHSDYRTRGQQHNFLRLIPLYEVREDVFSEYFPTHKD